MSTDTKPPAAVLYTRVQEAFDNLQIAAFVLLRSIKDDSEATEQQYFADRVIQHEGEAREAVDELYKAIAPDAGKAGQP